MTGMQTALLDNIRISNGPDSLRTYFHELLHTDREKLLQLLRDGNLRFCSLYILRQDIASASLLEELPPLYRKALEITKELSEHSAGSSVPKASGRVLSRAFFRTPAGIRRGSARRSSGLRLAQIESRMRSETRQVSPALEWIVKTGWEDDLGRAAYELLLERCSGILLKSFRNSSLLAAVAEKIFDRNRQGKLIHNLVWAFFEACNPDSLYLIAQRLISADSKDTALARKLLCFIPGLEEAAGTLAYLRAMQWISENRPFLCYTGETMQMCSRPVCYAVSLEAKYLCRPVSPDSGRPLYPLEDWEMNQLVGFSKLTGTEQQHLASFSCMLHQRDIYRWDPWIRQPVDKQAETVSEITGGSA